MIFIAVKHKGEIASGAFGSSIGFGYNYRTEKIFHVAGSAPVIRKLDDSTLARIDRAVAFHVIHCNKSATSEILFKFKDVTWL